ncbi:hypothetical protein BTUL_0014g00160 [Botrytis tulipae]|uniref:Ent-kaurene synthase n=1 Tax=Botrytis tulipae TaxID=87230 RepID=A0A4Z1F4H1_9HELO|nr:hypothetical protein BTUL_0014g00160 [Botrytis tulipae]
MDHFDVLEAKFLVGSLANESFRAGGSGSMSTSIYDTAWVSMVSKDVDGVRHWLFPEAFQHIVDAQAKDGSWESYSSQVDGILNTMAALLAFVSHQSANNFSYSVLPPDIDARILKAQDSLRRQLQTWDVRSCVHVGFEILVPALLGMLEQYNVVCEFPGRTHLLQLNQEKLSRFQPEIFYKNIQVTALHSLEAFIGAVDFNRIKHHLKNGSIMASPSSTAAYLMNTSTWDNESEIYLRNTIIEGAGKGNGSVPCAFPTTFFEFTWVRITRKQSFLITLIAPSLLPDADDTAKCILTLCLVGRSVSAEQMIANFEVKNHFQTYALERNGSISANCNVLNALLHINEPNEYIGQILSTTEFLCNSWSAGKIDDKWNLSRQYSMMLLAQTFRKLVMVWDSGALPDFPEEQLKDKIPVILLQILHRTLHNQNSNGSWGTSGSCEITAYGILTLIDATFFPWAGELDKQVLKAIRTGQSYLNQQRDSWDKVTYTWVEKVSYGSSILSRTYCIAATHAAKNYPTNSAQWKPLPNILSIPFDRVAKFAKFFSAIPLFASESSWKLTASIMEGYLFLPRLRRIRLDIFPRQNMAEDKYLEYIPFTWTGCNNKGVFLETDLIWDMMVISMLNYQADEFMEAVLGHNGSAKHLIRVLFSKTTLRNDPLSSQESSSIDRGIITPVNSDDGLPDDSTNDDRDTLIRFKDHVLNHPSIQKASESSLAHLSKQLEAFLLAHLTHSTDNSRFAQLSGHDADAPVTFPSSRTYWDWVRNISAVHTSCPYSWDWISCRMTSDRGDEPFPTALTKYLSAELGQHLAVMCRMYNDYGSLARDKAEKNLNSVNFPEFEKCAGSSMSSDAMETQTTAELQERKSALMEMAEYERECLLIVKARLRPLVGEKVRGVLDVFVNVTDLYGQIYVARDIASRMS